MILFITFNLKTIMLRSIATFSEPVFDISVFIKDTQTEFPLNVLKKFIEGKCSFDFYLDCITKFPIYIYKIIDHMPISMFYKLYNEANFLDGYLTKTLLNQIVDNSYTRLKCYIMNQNQTHVRSELIDITNSCSCEWNFIPELFIKRLKLILDKFGLNFKDFYYGESAITLLCNNANYKNNQKCKIVLYPVNRTVNLNDSKVSYASTHYHLYSDGNVDIEIMNNMYDDINRVLENNNALFNPTNELGDGEKFLITSNYYKMVLTNINPPVTPNTSITNANANTIYIKNKLRINFHTFKKYSSNQFIKRCYTCKKMVPERDYFERYKSMCMECGIFNYEHRVKGANLTGKKALITGIRHTIGFNTVLKLLRCGCTVYGTSRFPAVTKDNYKTQRDYDQWKDRLIIMQCDFLSIASVMNLIEILKSEHIDFLINNATQTTKSSDTYMKKLAGLEHHITNSIQPPPPQPIESQPIEPITESVNSSSGAIELINTNATISAIDISDVNLAEIQIDRNHNIVEERRETSWHQKLEDVSVTEIIEANLINQIVPTLLVSKLKPTMNKPSFIINVTAREGQFSYANKNEHHAHTNMCKAGLNMMTLTLAQENEPGFYIHSIDPGYVSGINYDQAVSAEAFPLEGDDGASRILQPMIEYFTGTPLPSNYLLLRDYVKAEW